MSWFEVSKDGLRQLLEGKDKSYILRELLQNSWDEAGVTEVHVRVSPIPGKVAALVRVEDDAPEGFYDLAHAYTMFGATRKRKDPSKRGRFNLGEKQVLALARSASIQTTTGTIYFREDGKRTKGRAKTEAGSIFEAVIPMTRDEIADALVAAQSFVPPDDIATWINGERLLAPVLVAEVPASLLTEYENADGQYRATKRNTTVRVYKPSPDEKPMIFEMGLPIIELEGGDCYHYDIQQRVPMTTDRDNVRPSFLQDVRAEVLNKVAGKLSEEQSRERWVTEAVEDDRVAQEAVREVVGKRFGDKVVTMDPSDPRANEKAIANGYTMIPGGSLTGEAWRHVKEAGAIPSSSSLFATIGVEATVIPVEKWTPEMRRIVSLVRRITIVLEQPVVFVEMVRSKAHDAATYCDPGRVSFNVSRLGRRWFTPANLEEQVALIVHELAHRYGGHLEMSYHYALGCFAAKLALAKPGQITKNIDRFLKGTVHA